MKRYKVLALIIGTLICIIVALVLIAVNSNSKKSASFKPGLSEVSRSELQHLPFCEVSRKTEVPAKMIAGVVLAEKQLNRDWSDLIQDSLFKVAFYLRSNLWWQEWSDRSLALASRDLSSRTKVAEWSSNVSWTGIIFSIGPSQITPRTAIQACQFEGSQYEWCRGTKRLIEALLSESESIEVAAHVLDVERKLHLKATNIDLATQPGKWGTLYNFGGDIFRARFKDNPNRMPNDFGRWIENNATEIDAILNCEKSSS